MCLQFLTDPDEILNHHQSRPGLGDKLSRRSKWHHRGQPKIKISTCVVWWYAIFTNVKLARKLRFLLKYLLQLVVQFECLSYLLNNWHTVYRFSGSLVAGQNKIFDVFLGCFLHFCGPDIYLSYTYTHMTTSDEANFNISETLGVSKKPMIGAIAA